MEEVKKILKELGYTENDINEIINAHGINGLKQETLLNNIKRNYDYLISLGYSKAEVLKMTKGLPTIYGLSIEKMKQKLDDMVELGYSKEEVLKMTKGLPNIYGYSIENIRQKIDDMVELGYSRAEVLKMTKGLPTIYGLNIENMKQKIDDMVELGYSKADVLKMTKGLPTIYGLSIENIKQKIEFYDSIGLHSIMVADSKRLMQSTALSYARYMFYKSQGINIDETNYRKLFIGQKEFERQYGVKKEELLAKYDYKEYLESLSKKDVKELGIETVEEQKDVKLLDQIEKEQARKEKENNKDEKNEDKS